MTVDKPSKVVYKDLVFIPEEEQVSSNTARVTLETESNVVYRFPVDIGWDAKSLRREICNQILELKHAEFEYVEYNLEFSIYFKQYLKQGKISKL